MLHMADRQTCRGHAKQSETLQPLAQACEADFLDRGQVCECFGGRGIRAHGELAACKQDRFRGLLEGQGGVRAFAARVLTCIVRGDIYKVCARSQLSAR
jgi:hypothetical protein